MKSGWGTIFVTEYLVPPPLPFSQKRPNAPSQVGRGVAESEGGGCAREARPREINGRRLGRAGRGLRAAHPRAGFYQQCFSAAGSGSC
jgi:hypothetical protein